MKIQNPYNEVYIFQALLHHSWHSPVHTAPYQFLAEGHQIFLNHKYVWHFQYFQ